MTKTIEEVLQMFGPEKSELISILQQFQEEFGYLPREIFKAISDHINVSVNEIYGVATFYGQFSFDPPARHQIEVCLGTACHVCGNQEILNTIKEKLDMNRGEKSKNGLFSVKRVACIGACALAPVVVIDKNVYAKMTKDKILQILEKYRKEDSDYFAR